MKTTPLFRKQKHSGLTLQNRPNFNHHIETEPQLNEEGISSYVHLRSLTRKKHIEYYNQPVYHTHILKVLDDLQCPMLLLPRISREVAGQRIGFFTDILYTGTFAIALLVKIAQSFQASITVFNIAEPALPEMDPGYADRYFIAQGMSNVNGYSIKLVNLKKGSSRGAIESLLNQHHITLLASMQRRKDLLYSIAV